MKPMLFALAAAAVASAALPAAAQTLDQRQHHQELRIEQGVRSGALTRGEFHRLQAREHALRIEEARARARHGGRLTPAERARFRHEETRLGLAIERAKHNAVRRF